MKYLAHFKIYSEYENINENIDSELILELDVNSKNEIQKILENFEEEMDWDDSEVINFDAKSDLICTTKEFCRLTDHEGNEIEI